MQAYAHIYGKKAAPHLIILVGENEDDAMFRYGKYCEGCGDERLKQAHIALYDVSPWIVKNSELIQQLIPDQKDIPISMFACFWTNFAYAGVLLAPAGSVKDARNALIDEAVDLNIEAKWLKQPFDVSDNLARIKAKLADVTVVAAPDTHEGEEPRAQAS